jgi:hypothetical protein
LNFDSSAPSSFPPNTSEAVTAVDLYTKIIMCCSSVLVGPNPMVAARRIRLSLRRSPVTHLNVLGASRIL